MKKLSSKITAVLFAACISLNTLASTITVNWDGTGDTSGFGSPEDWALSVVIKPETLTIYDSIEIISTGVRGSGPVTVENTFFQIDEAALTLDIFLNVGFLTVVSPWHYTENIGTLPAGVYDLTVTAYADYGPPETFFTSLNVVVPEPTITVNWDGTGDFLTIQDAINAASDGDVVVIENGEYIGVGNRDISFYGKEITVRSQSGPDKCIINCQGSKDNLHRGFIFNNDENQNSILDGVTVINGCAGGGGGAIYCYRSNPTILNCHFINNESLAGAAAIYYWLAPRWGLVKNCIVRNNAGTHSGGVHCNDNVKFVGCIIENNKATAGSGGGVLCGSCEFLNCIIRNNYAKWDAGGINVYNDTKMTNCVISNNYAGSIGGGICVAINRYISLELNNCTVVYNNAESGTGGLMCRSTGQAFVRNSIFWNNGEEEFGVHGGSSHVGKIFVSYSNVKNKANIIEGERVLSVEPFFIDPDNNDFRLSSESESIDSGENTFVAFSTDMLENPRIIDGDLDGIDVVDMGAYEFIPSIKVSVDIKPQSCPNPVNVKSKGVLPVAILGSDVLDVNDIDLDTILLEGVAPLRGSYGDVASPVIDETECACSLEGADGYMDLTLKFETQEVITALGELVDEEMWMLSLTGYLKDGTPIEGADCIIIKKKGK